MDVQDDDVIVNVQGDQPLFEPIVVSDMIRPLVEDRTLLMSTLKKQIAQETEIQNPNHVKVITDREGFALYFSRYPIPYCRDQKGEGVHFKHLGFYAFRMSFLKIFSSLPRGVLEGLEQLEQLRALENGYRIKVIETKYDSIEVDVPDDVNRIENALRNDPKTGG